MQKFNLEKARNGCILVDKENDSEYIFYAYNKNRGCVFVRPVPDIHGRIYEFKQENIFIKED